MMDMNLQLLKDALQMLALPITAQIHLDQNEVGRVERLRKLFIDGYCLVRYELNGQLSWEQKRVLSQIDSLLFGMNPGMNWLVWSEEKLRRNAAWRKVRAYAREALVQFNWPLELPSGDLFDDQPLNQYIICLEAQAAMSCCYA
jgi:hypothetical protein